MGTQKFCPRETLPLHRLWLLSLCEGRAPAGRGKIERLGKTHPVFNHLSFKGTHNFFFSSVRTSYNLGFRELELQSLARCTFSKNSSNL